MSDTNWNRRLGLNEDGTVYTPDQEHLHNIIALKLSAAGLPIPDGIDLSSVQDAADLLTIHRQQRRMLDDTQCPIDSRIQAFLEKELDGIDGDVPRLPSAFELDRHGLARELSIPHGENEHHAERVSSYRLDNGVLHNPFNDRRTTKGVFHIAEGGLPIPGDKKAVPMLTFKRLLRSALNDAPDELLTLPFTAKTADSAKTFVSLMLRPTVCPEIPERSAEKSMEIRFFAPGSLVCNLDFVESIFGNAGNASLPSNDSALDCEHWTGHTGCVILATHLTQLKKKDLGLPHKKDATERQIKDGMCWEDANELYNDGTPFKICHRTKEGIMVTVIADNYFGYCKKEVKTQIGFSSNIYGMSEEEHAGGALAFPRYSLGHYFNATASAVWSGKHFMNDVKTEFADVMEMQAEGHGIDKRYNSIIYVPENAEFSLPDQSVSWTDSNEDKQKIPLRPENVYILPHGYKVSMERHPGAPSWRLVGTSAEGTFCHKPCTVSGGGKSEISKSFDDFIIYGPIYVADYEKDFDLVQEIFDYDYSKRFLPEHQPDYNAKPSRSVLSVDRSIGSVIKLLTPSKSEYTKEYNDWLESLPIHIKALVFIIKRFYNPAWGNNWREHFMVDVVDGRPAHELKFENRKLMGSYVRVGINPDESWCTYKLRQDFLPASKVQMEDDITASTIVPLEWVHGPHPGVVNKSVKLTRNCEYRLFQRPDEAIHRGFDKQTEFDMAQKDLFASNYQALTQKDLARLCNKTVTFEQYTQPMRRHLRNVSESSNGKFGVSSAHPRIVDGKPTKNPRYLQLRPDFARSRDRYIADMGMRLTRKVTTDKTLSWGVNAVISGRRNNPASEGIRALAVYGPIHYQELPELFMDFVCSLTGKSPSTTGAGSEGALTKGPFNALQATADLNNALIGMIISGYDGFSSAAGYIGPNKRVDHDISLLIPEIWSRISIHERSAKDFLKRGLLEKLEDFEHDGKTIHASRLGYRITSDFVRHYFGKVFDNPAAVFDEAILKPETQNEAQYIDGILNIAEAQAKVAQQYLDDGSVDYACPPLKALLHIMATGTFEGKDIHDPVIRQLFEREYVIASDWYQERLQIKQDREIALWQSHINSLEAFMSDESNEYLVNKFDLTARLDKAQETLTRVSSDAYRESLVGTIGADPIDQKCTSEVIDPRLQTVNS